MCAETASQASEFFTVRCKTCIHTLKPSVLFYFDKIIGTFIADVESCVVIGLIGDELDSHSRAFADHSLERYLPTVTRVKEHNRTSIQSTPQHQPARPELMDRQRM